MMKTYSGNDLTVVIPAHNCERYIVEALQSIESQTIWPGRVLVVENASNDGTRECVEGFAQTSDLPVKLVHTDCPGVSNARNIGFSLAETTLIAMLDADDIYTDGFLAQALCAFNAVPNLGFFFGDRMPFSEGEAFVKKAGFLEKSGLMSIDYEELVNDIRLVKGDLFPVILKGCFVPPSGTVLRRQYAYDVGLFPVFLSSSEDRHFFSRLALVADAAYTLQVSHNYRVHNASKTGSSAWLELCKNSVLALSSLTLELSDSELKPEQRIALHRANDESIGQLLYTAADQGWSSYSSVRSWLQEIGIKVPFKPKIFLKSLKNAIN